MLTTALAIAETLRPHNMLAAAGCVVSAYVISGGTDAADVAAPALLTGLVTGFGNLINDYYDRETDAINKPSRPLPSGRLSPTWVVASYWAGSILATMAIVVWLSGPLRILVLAWQVLLYSYARVGKRVTFAGGILVASIAASAFWGGATLTGYYDVVWFPVVFAFLLVMGRELLKGAEDVEGDRATGARTPAVRFGPHRSARWGAATLALCVIVVPLPGLTREYGRIYVFAMELLFVPGVLAAAVMAARRPEPSVLKRASSILKLQMFVGIIALALARL
jgi:geranylgeranylglycerol-phosphate geranylgeranyltransferase